MKNQNKIKNNIIKIINNNIKFINLKDILLII